MDLNAQILHRFFEGKYSRNDFLIVKSFFTTSQNREKLRKLMREHWIEFGDSTLPEGNIDHVLHKIHHQIHLEETIRPGRRYMMIFQRVAAILIIPLLLSFLAVFYFQSRQTPSGGAYAEIQCPMGVRTKFVLPDGTSGFLNSGSRLKYPVPFNKSRTVSLSGEAFFDVISREDEYFTVETPNLSTRVLGTQFNVIAYADDQDEEVILQEGKVEIYYSSGKKLDTLSPDERLVLNSESRKFRKIEVEAFQYISWTEGKLVFRNENMKEVADRLGRWYNADIEIEDPELLNYAFRATFIDEPLDQVLKLLALTAPFSFEELPRESSEESMYKKRKVIVRLDEQRVDAF